ncbi:MAG: ferredoxin reductase [Chloroflexota bacterium]
MPEPLAWQIATVTAIRAETPEVSSFTLRLPNWRVHRAGQHYDVRLTASDGYQAQRSYSIASPPSRTGEVDLTIEKIADGEVPPYFHDILTVGDQVEVRGPIGGYFVWEPAIGGPLVLVAGGSGIVPLMAMLRERASAEPKPAAVLLYSSRTYDDVIYRDELASLDSGDAGLRVIQTLTRSHPAGWAGYDRRIDRPMLTEAIDAAGPDPLVYICGPTLLVEAAANGLVEHGVPPAQVRTERFGPTS